jgi:DNA adenine methylase
LNEKGIAFIVSYDGRTGDKQYGAPLPASLGLKHHEVHVGRSTQSTLLGRDDETFESIYLSPVLLDRLGHITRISKPAAPRLFAIGSK